MSDSNELISEELINMARWQAINGERPHNILKNILPLLERYYEGHIPRISMEVCLMRAFGVPLRYARDIEEWNGFWDKGSVSDDDVDRILEPWIAAFIKRDRSQ